MSENYQALRDNGLFAAGVPAELGGGGASHAELCAMIRELAHHCSSTALAASMHTHPVAAHGLRVAQRKQGARADAARVAAERLILATSGGSDWLPGSGTLRRSTAASR